MLCKVRGHRGNVTASRRQRQRRRSDEATFFVPLPTQSRFCRYSTGHCRPPQGPSDPLPDAPTSQSYAVNRGREAHMMARPRGKVHRKFAHGVSGQSSSSQRRTSKMAARWRQPGRRRWRQPEGGSASGAVGSGQRQHCPPAKGVPGPFRLHWRCLISGHPWMAPSATTRSPFRRRPFAVHMCRSCNRDLNYVCRC